MKGIPLKLPQHKIELDIIISLAHQAKYKLNPNNVVLIKQYINKLLAIGFIEYVEETTWLSPIEVVPKKNYKLKICIDFRKLNTTTNKDPYPLPFTYEALNTVVGYKT